MLFQTCTRFFILLKTKEDILKNFDFPIDFPSSEINSMKVNGDHQNSEGLKLKTP